MLLPIKRVASKVILVVAGLAAMLIILNTFRLRTAVRTRLPLLFGLRQFENNGGPTIESDSSFPSKFPRLIHMTLKSKLNMSTKIRSNIQSFKELNPSFDVMLYDDNDMRNMVKEHKPHMIDTFDSFETNVERADFWRYLVMHVKGGVYVDSDVKCVKPIHRWIEVFGHEKEKLNAIIGIEANFEDEKEARRQRFVSSVQFCQWTFMSTPGHPLFNRTLNNIYDLVQKEKHNSLTLEGDHDFRILLRTGPGMFTRTVEELLIEENLTSRDVTHGFKVANDIGILTSYGFGFRPDLDPYPEDYNLEVCVLHLFFGGWKEN
jgi:mannosyltransferase OCH1-like enzyme